MSVSILTFVCLVFTIICIIGAITGLSPKEMIAAITPTRRRYWLRRYVDRELAGLTREPTRGDVASAVERFESSPQRRIREMKDDDRRRKLTEELLPTSARIAELENELDPKPSSLGRAERPWEVYPYGWRQR